MAQISHIDIGDLIVAQATFKNAAGADTDPTNLTVRQQDPAGAETVLLNNVATSGLNAGTSPVAKTATGVYKLNPGVEATMPGQYVFNFKGTGAVAAAAEFLYIADPSEFVTDSGISSRALVTLAEARDWLQNTIATNPGRQRDRPGHQRCVRQDSLRGCPRVQGCRREPASAPVPHRTDELA